MTAPAAARRRPLRLAVLLALVLVALLAIRAPWFGQHLAPDELIGLWASADSAYAGRTLEIRADHLVFHAPEAAQPAYSVRRVERLEQGARIRYRIEYLIDGSAATLSLIYARGPDVIRLDSKPQLLWRRVRTHR